MRELRNLIHIYSSDADLVVSASLRFADGFVFTGPTGIGQQILNGRRGNGEVSTLLIALTVRYLHRVSTIYGGKET